MKKLVFLILMLLSLTAFSQTKVSKSSDGYYKTEKVEKVKPVDTGLKFKTADGEVFPIYKSGEGKYFIIRTSKKTGKQYRQYLEMEQ